VSTIQEHLKPTLKVVEFYYIGNSLVYVLVTDSEGKDHFIGGVTPIGQLTITDLAKKHGITNNVFHKRFSSMDDFEKFAKTHEYLSKFFSGRENSEVEEWGKAPMST